MDDDSRTAPYAFIVDDNPMILMHAADILEDAGFRALSAYDGDAALRLLEEKGSEVMLLFTDVEMPGSIDGFELARTTAQRWPEIAILVASGLVTPKDGDLPEGAIFISKPFSADVVHGRLHEILSEGQKPESLKRKATG